MPRHKPIYFKDPRFSDEFKNRLKTFVKKHPVASSAAKAVLATAILGGVLTVATVAPGVLAVLGKGVISDRKARSERYRTLWARFHAMKKRKIFEYQGESSDGGAIYRFTENGKVVAKKFLLETLQINAPAKWDGKWRVVVFDIPEKYKVARRALYFKLREMDFYPFQKSVWIHPFPCEKEIDFLKEVFNIYPFIEIFVANDVPSGKVLYHFKNLLKQYIWYYVL